MLFPQQYPNIRLNLFNCMFLKYATALLGLTFLLLALFSQPRRVTGKYDTCISIYSDWSCAGIIDAAKFSKKSTLLQNKSFDILKRENKYYLLKIVEHQQMESTGKLFFHNHIFKEIAIDSFSYCTIGQWLFKRLEHEKIKPFAFEYKDSTNKTIRVDGTSSHSCSVNLKIRFRGGLCSKWLDIRSLQQSDTARGVGWQKSFYLGECKL